jgi:hypothetical protein
LLVVEKLAIFHSYFWNKDIKKAFPELKKHNNPLFNPGWSNFINDKLPIFVGNWKNVLSQRQMHIAEEIKK